MCPPVRVQEFLLLLLLLCPLLLLLFLLSRHPWLPLSPWWTFHRHHSWCCWFWSGGAGLLQMIIRRGRPLANDHPEGPAYCKWSSVTPVTLVNSARNQIQSRGPFYNNLFLLIFFRVQAKPKHFKYYLNTGKSRHELYYNSNYNL